MSKLILCTTGTSIANGCPSLRRIQGHLSRWEDEDSEFETEVMEKIAGLDYRNDPEVRRKLSAELNTLDRMGLEAGDKVVLLATDSLPGRICSEALSGVIEEVWQAEVEIDKIAGMQVYDAKRLREEGLKNLVKQVLEYLDDDTTRYSYDDIIINPTGGYKAIVPFLTVLGMLYGRKAIYLFEHSEELIELPPLPLTFDLQLFERVKGALKFIEEEVAVSPEAYFSRIVGYDPAERDLFLSFTEPMDEKTITLSPLAYVLLKIEESGETCMVSDEVRQTLSKLKGEKREILERMIDNSANPLWRHQKMHRWPNSKILIIKPGSTAERVAGYMKGGTFHIALAFESHDTYEKELGKYTLEQLQQMHYTPWEKRSLSGENVVSESVMLSDDERRSLMEEIDRLKRELSVMEERAPQNEPADLDRSDELEQALAKSEEENLSLLVQLEEEQKKREALLIELAKDKEEKEQLAEQGRKESEALYARLAQQEETHKVQKHALEKKGTELEALLVSEGKRLQEKKLALKASRKALKEKTKMLTAMTKQYESFKKEAEENLGKEKKKKKALKQKLREKRAEWKRLKKDYSKEEKRLKQYLEKIEKKYLKVKKKYTKATKNKK